MPRDLPTDVGAGADGGRKKKRRADPYTSPEPHYDPQPTYNPPTVYRDPANTAQRLSYIEGATNGVLPSEVTWALGNAKLEQKDIARAARYFARNFDLPVNDFLNPVVGQDIKGMSLIRYEDPINGGLLTLRSARRLLEQAEPQIISRWLEAEPSQGPKDPAISSKNIIRVLNDLTPYVGEQLNIGQALSISRAVVSKHTGKTFKQNLEAVMNSSLRADPMMALSVAADAAEKGKTFNDYTDVLSFLVGGEVEEGGTIKTGVDIDPKTGLATVHEEQYVQMAGVPGVAVITDLYNALKDKSVSYSEEADKIMREMEARQEDVGIGGKIVGAVFHGLEIVNRPLDAFVRVFGDPEAWTGPMLALMGEEGAMEPTEVALKDAKEILLGDASVFDLQRMKDLGWDAGEIITWQLALSIGLPAGASAKAFAEAGSVAGKAGAAALYAGEFALDPLTSGGKLARVAGGRKFLPFLNAADQEKAVLKFLGSDAITDLTKAAIKSTDDGDRFFREAVSKFRTSYATDGIHPLTARSIQSFAKKATAAGLDEETISRGVRDFFADALGLPVKNPLVDEIKDLAYNAQKASLKKTAKALAEPMTDEEIMVIARRNAQDLEDQLGRAHAEAESLGPIMHEIPHVRALNKTRETLIPSLGDSKLGRAKRALAVSELPLRSGSYFKFLPDQDLAATIDGVDTVLTRSRVFSQDEMAAWKQRMSNAARPGFAARERQMGEVLEQINDEMLARIGRETGVTTDQMMEFVDKTFGRGTGVKSKFRALRGTDFEDAGVYAARIEGGDEIVRKVPLMQSQLQNAYQLIDPVHVRKAIKEQIGYVRELRAMAARAIGKAAPATKGAFTLTPSRAIGEISRDVWRPAIGLVKFGWVARPAYVLRIVAGDELLRFLSTEGLATRLRAGRVGSDVAARFEGLGLKDMLRSEGKLATAPELVDAGRVGDDFASRFPGVLEDNPQAGQGAIKFMANAQGDILPSDIKDAFVEHWGAVYKGALPNAKDDERFVASWYRALFQTGQDPGMGREILRARAAGLDEEATITRVRKFLKEDPIGRTEVNRMKQEPLWDLDEAVRTQTEYVFRLTPNKALADNVVDGSFTPELLTSMNRELWPAIVHGPALNASGKKSNLLGRIGQAWGRAILEMPTNKLIRQPFYKANYTQIYDFLVDQAQAAGKVVDDAMDRSFKAEADRFAIKRTQQIMFDFTRSGRIAELAWFVSPFLQPFTEFFVAWPRIIKQNPAMLGYINRLGNAAHDSKFFQEDDNGQLVIPASNFMGAAPLLAAFTGGRMTNQVGGGWNLSMPLASFNMFTNSAFPVNVGGIDVPIPTPSFSPPAQWALQQFIDGVPMDAHLKEKMTAWLTEYGEVSATRPQDWALPSWLRHAMTAAVPSWFQDTTNRNTNGFLAMQQAMGMNPNEEDAHWQAQQFSGLRALYAAFFPASPQIQWPTQELEDEYDALYKANPDTAYEEFVGTWNPTTKAFEGGRHNGLTLIAAAKTMWNDEDNPFPMPANQLSERILNSKGGKEFAAQHPRFVYFIVPKEIRDGEMDLGVFNDQIADGERKIRTPEEFTANADDRAAWSAAFARREQWTAWQEAHPDQESGDIGYDTAQGAYEGDIDSIAEHFPGWEGAAEIKLPTRVDPGVLREMFVMAQSEEFTTKTDFGKGLKDYVDLRRELVAEMEDKNISNLDTVVAENAGLTKKWDDGVAAIIAEHPDFGLGYDVFKLDMDLRNVRTVGEKALDGLDETVLDEVVNPWVDKWEKVKSAPYDGSIVLADQRFAAYAHMRDYADTAYKYPPGQNPLKLWWGTQNPQEKSAYLVSVGGRDGIYWSRFDWEVMAKASNNKQIMPTKQTATFWDQVDKARSEAFQKNNTDPGFSLPDQLELIDRGIAKAVAKNPKLRAQLDVMNTWGYGLRNVVLTGGDSPAIATQGTKKDWEEVFKAGSDLQKFLQDEELTGQLYDPDDIVYVKSVKTALGKWLGKKQKQNKAFAKQWAYVSDLMGGDLIIDEIMPDEWFALGTVGDAPATIVPAGKAHVEGRKLRTDERTGLTLAAPALRSMEAAMKELDLPQLGEVAGGYRTAEEQQALYNNRGNNPLPVAPPGSSNHEKGLAVDIPVTFLDAHPELVDWLRRNGWTNLAGDPPHWDYTG